MKKILALVLSIIMILSFAACGKEEASEPQKTEEQTVTNVDDLLVDDTEKTEADTVDSSPVDEALKFVDKPISDFIAQYGEPKGKIYSPSCLGDGEDGELAYESFTVYTYKEGDQETVLDVR